MIEQVDTDSLLSFAAPWKCFTFTDKLMISFASISAVIGIALVVWYLYSSYFNRGCRGRYVCIYINCLLFYRGNIFYQFILLCLDYAAYRNHMEAFKGASIHNAVLKLKMSTLGQ